MEPKKENENVMEIDGSSVASDSANSAYPNLCVYPVSIKSITPALEALK